MASSDGWAVYILRCADGALYTGITVDLDRRLAAHNAGKGARFTRARLPVEVRWSLRGVDGTLARRLEWAIKQLSREQKERLIGGQPLRNARAEKALSALLVGVHQVERA